MSFKIKLLTPRVTAESSNTAGDIIEVENDEAYRMIEAGLGELVSKIAPVRPKDKASK